MHSKIIESVIIPNINVQLNDYQFGFRPGRSTSHACSIVNDVVQYFKSQHSSVYICAFDAEKCFDIRCHTSLSYMYISLSSESLEIAI